VDALERVDFAVQIHALNARLLNVAGQVFRQALGQSGDQRSLTVRCPSLNLMAEDQAPVRERA